MRHSYDQSRQIGRRCPDRGAKGTDVLRVHHVPEGRDVVLDRVVGDFPQVGAALAHVSDLFLAVGRRAHSGTGRPEGVSAMCLEVGCDGLLGRSTIGGHSCSFWD